jgi:alcohol dehydrogenase
MNPELVEKIVTLALDETGIRNAYEFRVPPTSVVGDGIAVKAGDYLTGLGVTHAFIVTDAHIVRLGLLEPLLRSLERSHIRHTLFAEVEPDPTDQVVQRGIARLEDVLAVFERSY